MSLKTTMIRAAVALAAGLGLSPHVEPPRTMTLPDPNINAPRRHFRSRKSTKVQTVHRERPAAPYIPAPRQARQTRRKPNKLQLIEKVRSHGALISDREMSNFYGVPITQITEARARGEEMWLRRQLRSGIDDNVSAGAVYALDC
jgi:hypothetical protein